MQVELLPSELHDFGDTDVERIVQLPQRLMEERGAVAYLGVSRACGGIPLRLWLWGHRHRRRCMHACHGCCP